MSRFMAFANLRKVANYVYCNHRNSLLKSNKERGHHLLGLPYNSYRLYVQYRHSLQGYNSRTLCVTQRNLLRSGVLRNFRSFSSGIAAHHHAQVAWRRLYQIYLRTGPQPINKIACAVSLALTRSNLIVPGLISFIVGHIASSQQTWAQAEAISAKETLSLQAHGKFYFTTVAFLLIEALILFLRTLYLAIVFFPCLALVPFADTLGPKFRKYWLQMVHHTLAKAGPAFIKWGQWAATRPDLFPRDLCDELSELHTNAPAHNFAFTKRSIENAFGRKLQDIFENFEEEPLASGSIAQVHRAILKYRYPGRPIKQPIVVAVKVRHPGVGEAIRRDFMIINFVARISTLLPMLNWLRLDESIQQFAVYMMSQVDLSREAAHLNRFIYNFRRSKDVSFPRPLYPLVHPAVLVETYEQGENILQYVDELQGNERVKSVLAHIGTNALLKMLLVDNFIHADMHPGNILVRSGKDKSSSEQLFPSRPHVVFLDVGMTAELSKRERTNIIDFFKAVALRDGRSAAECTLSLSTRQNCPNPRAFIEDVERSFCLWDSEDGELTQPADCIQQLLEQVRHHKVNIDGNVCTVIVTTLVLEGWQHKLDPDYDVMNALRSLLFKAEWAETLSYTMEGLAAP